MLMDPSCRLHVFHTDVQAKRPLFPFITFAFRFSLYGTFCLYCCQPPCHVSLALHTPPPTSFINKYVSFMTPFIFESPFNFLSSSISCNLSAFHLMFFNFSFATLFFNPFLAMYTKYLSMWTFRGLQHGPGSKNLGQGFCTISGSRQMFKKQDSSDRTSSCAWISDDCHGLVVPGVTRDIFTGQCPPVRLWKLNYPSHIHTRRHTNHYQSLHMIGRILQSRQGKGKKERREETWSDQNPTQDKSEWEWNAMQPIPKPKPTLSCTAWWRHSSSDAATLLFSFLHFPLN